MNISDNVTLLLNQIIINKKHINIIQQPDNDIVCKECNSLHIKEIDGYYTCLDCGLKNDHIIDCGQEWNVYANDIQKGDNPARCDIPTNELLPKASLGSFIGYGNKETYTTKRIRNMSNWYSMTYKDMLLIEMFSSMNVIAHNSGINQCILEEAKYIYKIISELKTTRKTKKDIMKACCISLACKLKGVPRNCNEIANICHVKNNKTLRKSIKIFEEIWNSIQINEQEINNINTHLLNNSSPNYNIQLNITYIPDQQNYNNTIDYNDINNSHDYYESIYNTNTSIDNNLDNDIDNNVDNDVDNYNDIIMQDCITKLHRYFAHFCIEDSIFQYCKTIFIYIEQHDYLSNYNPLSKIASIIFYANEYFNLNINKYIIFQTCEVSEVTINKCYQKIIKYIKLMQ